VPVEVPEAHCPGCGSLVDPLRAGQVAILENRFEYFCGIDCKQAYLRVRVTSSHEDQATAEPPPVRSRDDEVVSTIPAPEVPEVPEVQTVTAAAAAPAERLLSGRERTLAILDYAGVLFGLLVVALGLVDGAELIRVALAVCAWLVLAARTWRTERDAADLNPLATLLPPAIAAGLAVWAQASGDSHAMAVTDLVGAACAVSLVLDRLAAGVRDTVAAERAGIVRSLDVPVRVVRAGELRDVVASEVRPGEPVVAIAGEVIGVDAIVSRGEARVVPWLGAGIEVGRREGDPIVAGARVVSNRLQITTTWSGRDRAWVKLLSTPGSRIDVAAPMAKTLRRAVQWGAPAAGALAAGVALAANGSFAQVVASFAAGVIATTSSAAPAIVALLYARAHLRALGMGIAYRDAAAFERAGAAEIAVLSARGTVLLGEPEIVTIESAGAAAATVDLDAQEAHLLALAAGAETGSSHPFAVAILRAARARGVTPDHVRNPNAFPGLGVTAIASTGERLVVGGRALMLLEKIGGAVAEARVSELQSQGRSVVLVALGDRLVGLIALQDGLRPGARAAVQKLLDAGIEPVLLSGESRETCNAIGRALDIDHLRPEVLPGDRRAEILAVGEGGSVVGVIGHPSADDQALGAAGVAVAMGAAGATPGEWAVSLASSDVAHAADALIIPRRAIGQAKIASVLALAPGIFALLAITFGVAPLAVGPVAILLGAFAGAAYVRAVRDPSGA
jgi:Cu+-exporting ATPase